MSDFQLDARLAADTLTLGELPLSRLLLMKDGRYPWLVLVPRRAGLVEWFDLDLSEQAALAAEACQAGAALKAATGAAKINIAALGNIVSQLHLHVVARRPGDAAWPGPVWGVGKAEPYAAAPEALIAALREALEF